VSTQDSAELAFTYEAGTLTVSDGKNQWILDDKNLAAHEAPPGSVRGRIEADGAVVFEEGDVSDERVRRAGACLTHWACRLEHPVRFEPVDMWDLPEEASAQLYEDHYIDDGEVAGHGCPACGVGFVVDGACVTECMIACCPYCRSGRGNAYLLDPCPHWIGTKDTSGWSTTREDWPELHADVPSFDGEYADLVGDWCDECFAALSSGKEPPRTEKWLSSHREESDDFATRADAVRRVGSGLGPSAGLIAACCSTEIGDDERASRVVLLLAEEANHETVTNVKDNMPSDEFTDIFCERPDALRDELAQALSSLEGARKGLAAEVWPAASRPSTTQPAARNATRSREQ
jgi:hypothetical protein